MNMEQNFQSLPKLMAALAKFQLECPDIPRDKSVDYSTKSGNKSWKYASLESILKITRPVLAKHGLTVIHVPVEGNKLSALLMHESGEFIVASPLTIGYDANSAQSIGSAMTYSRRYSYCAILGIAAEDDDDGQAASINTDKQKQKSLISDKAYQSMLKAIKEGKLKKVSESFGYFTYTDEQREELEAAKDEWITTKATEKELEEIGLNVTFLNLQR